MSEHSKSLERKMAELDQKEMELKEELAIVSDDFGKSAKNMALIAVLAGVAAFAFYSLFRFLTGSGKKKVMQEEKKETISAAPPASGGIKYMIAEKVVTAALAFIGNLIADKVADSQKKKLSKDS